jgi:hypothetical protein
LSIPNVQGAMRAKMPGKSHMTSESVGTDSTPSDFFSREEGSDAVERVPTNLGNVIMRIAGDRKKRSASLPAKEFQGENKADAAPDREDRNFGQQSHQASALEHHGAQGIVKGCERQRLHEWLHGRWEALG